MNVLRLLAVSCVAAWLGIMVFFSLAVTPLMFRTMDRQVAADLAALVIPRYYAWGAGLCAMALLAWIGAALRRAPRRWVDGVSAVLTAAMLVMLGWALIGLLPRAERARRARDDATFVAAHRTAVRLNEATLAAGVAALLVQAVNRPGRRAR